MGAVVAFLEAEPDQRGAEGIVVHVGVGNAGPGPVEVLNPFEVVQFQVLDEGGFPVPLPARPPRLLVEPPGGDHPPALPVVGAWRDGRPDDGARIDARVVEVGSGEDVRVAMAIGDRRSDPAGRQALEDGRYRIGAILTLIDARDPSSSRVLQAAPLDVVLNRREPPP